MCLVWNVFQRLVPSREESKQLLEADECCSQLEEAVSMLQELTHSKTLL